ncbi:MAG: FAD-dependent oxidoreductase, partial [Bacteroidales bacterium]
MNGWADRIETLYGYPLQRIAAADIGRWIASPRYHSGVHDPRSGHLHPLKYTLGLAHAAAAAGVRLHEGTVVQALQPGAQPLLRSAAGAELRASQVLLAGNVYLQSHLSELPAAARSLATRIMPVGTYIACTERLPDV